MPSPEFKRMSTQIAQLAGYLLPRSFSPTGTYRYHKREAARTLAYRLMVHAEFEHYLETRSVAVALRAWKEFQNRGCVTHCALALLAFSQGKRLELPNSITCPNVQQQPEWESKLMLRRRLKAALDWYRDAVYKTNHGIREANVLAVLLPIGLDPDELDPLWLTSLDQFGRSRGLAAHKSLSIQSLTATVDPATERDLVVKQLLPGWEVVDTLLDKLV